MIKNSFLGAAWIALILVACNDAPAIAENPVDNQVAEQVMEEVVSAPEVYYPEGTADDEMQALYDNGVEGEQVFVRGEVIKNLPDDNEGSRHQKFLIRLESGQTLLVSHNIDLADRIDELQEGDEVAVFGQYEWNERGGVIHWTHHDPDGDHIDGWIEHEGLRYG